MTETPTIDPERIGNRLAVSLWVLRTAWRTAPRLTVIIALCTVLTGALPAAAAYVGKWIVDTVVMALELGAEGWSVHRSALLSLVGLEGGLLSALVIAQRAQAAAQAILRNQLSNRVSELILEKATSLSLPQYEDSEIHDRLMRARRDAATRPYSLMNGLFVAARNAVTLTTCILVLLELSWWAVVVVVVAGVPPFVAELRYSQQLFEQQRRRSPDQREQFYLEQLLSREDFAKEMKLYALNGPILDRFRRTAARIEHEERAITIRRNAWSAFFNVLGTLAFYGAYAWLVHRTVTEHYTLGQMTMYLAIFRQAQQGVTSGLSTIGTMLDDHLYLRDLQSFLVMPVITPTGTATSGPDPSAGLVVENLSFTYEGAPHPALDDVSFRVRPGEMVALVGQNGSGKTTLMKLLTRLYEPTSGRILLDGLDIREWDVEALRARYALVFQDFVRFKMTAGENIGAGDVAHWHDEERWQQAARIGLADEVVAHLPEGYRTPLGKWFRGGQELSGGQWQRIALSRAFMRPDDPILVLDEPTSALDPEAELQLFQHVHEAREGRMVILITHRFGSVRMADSILVMDQGVLVEHGAHDALMARDGLYARLFNLQAAGYLGVRPSLTPPAPSSSSRDDY